jgi:hypothetical protein
MTINLCTNAFRIFKNIIINQLIEIFEYYAKLDRADGLCHVLTVAAPKLAPTRPDLRFYQYFSIDVPIKFKYIYFLPFYK